MIRKSKFFLQNLEELTIRNKDFRNVLFTSSNLQIVLMTLYPGEEIGEEIHYEIDQFFRVESGKGELLINNDIYLIKSGFGILVPKGTLHNIKNTGKTLLSLYTIYSPPAH